MLVAVPTYGDTLDLYRACRGGHDEIELEANESGRLWAEDPEAWKRLCTTEACPLCGEDPHPEWILAETDICKISAWSEAVLPGWLCVRALEAPRHRTLRTR